MTTIERDLFVSREQRTPTRLTVVGMSDPDRDAAAIHWAIDASTERDLVHLVHAYVPVLLPECSWAPVVTRNDARRTAGRMSMAKALQRIRALGKAPHVDGSVVAGLPDDVLLEFSDVVDHIVICEDGPDIPPRRQVAHRLARAAHCPVAIVPQDYDGTGVRRNGPIVLLVDTPFIPQHALALAYAEAVRRDTTLCVAQFWTALHQDDTITAELLAAAQEQLDAQLVEFERGAHPVGVFSEILLDSYDEAVNRLRQSSRVVVVASTLVRMTRLTGPSTPGCCPVLVVPEVPQAWR